MKPVKLGLSAPLAFVALSLASAALLIVVVATARPAAADVSITFDELVFGPAGSVIEVEVVEVDAELVGMSCVLAVRSENQASVHIGNDLIVSTGDSQAVIVGVEDTANGGMSQTYDMVLGPQIRVEIRIGQDGMSSLGFGLSFECPDPTTTTVPPVSTTDTLPNPTLGARSSRPPPWSRASPPHRRSRSSNRPPPVRRWPAPSSACPRRRRPGP